MPLLYNTITYLYCLYSGDFTGDYLGVSINNNYILTFSYICSFIPYIILWNIYRRYKKSECKTHVRVHVNLSFLKWFIYFLFFWHILVTLLFGVGQLGDDAYQAPTFIKVFIQLFNRFPVHLVGALYIALCDERKRFHEFIKIALLIIIIGLARKSISSPIFVFYIYLIFYGDKFLIWAKKNLILLSIIMVLSPYLIGGVYSFRDSLRGKENMVELSSSQLVFGKFFGRLSSLSDTGFIMENLPYFAIQAQELDFYYYQRQVLSGTLGMSFAPDLTPERVLYNSLGDGSPNISYMCGVTGNMVLAFLKSPYMLVLNLASFILLLMITFHLAQRLSIPCNSELALLFLISPVMSGVANECAFISIVLLLFILLNMVVNGTFLKYKRVD